MIVLDTCVLIFDALSPNDLSSNAKKAINNAEKKRQLFCCEISLWEIAMLVQKKRLDVGTDVQAFLKLMLEAREIQTLGMNIEVAVHSTLFSKAAHFDPADRIIAATTMCNNAVLVTCDKKLQGITELSTIW